MVHHIHFDVFVDLPQFVETKGKLHRLPIRLL